MKKTVLCMSVLLVAIAMVFASCSAEKPAGGSNAKEPESQSAGANTGEEASTETALLETGETVSFSVTSEEAKNIAFEALQKKCSAGEYGSINDFEFEESTLLGSKQAKCGFNTGFEGCQNTTGHAYYFVSFKYTPELCDIAYFCVDAITGDILFESYMGD